MSKYFGKIGFIETQETAPSVWSEVVNEREYYGDVTRNQRRYDSADQLNDNLNVSNEIHIVADPYAVQNFHAIRYIWWMGTRWKISNVEVNYPRLRLTIGGVYNGPESS